MVHKDRGCIGFVLVFACVVSKNPKTSKLSPMVVQEVWDLWCMSVVQSYVWNEVDEVICMLGDKSLLYASMYDLWDQLSFPVIEFDQFICDCIQQHESKIHFEKIVMLSLILMEYLIALKIFENSSTTPTVLIQIVQRSLSPSSVSGSQILTDGVTRLWNLSLEASNFLHLSVVD